MSESKTDSWGPRITFSRTAEDGSVKSIELPAPSSIIMEERENLTPEDLQTEKDLGDLMFDMFFLTGNKDLLFHRVWTEVQSGPRRCHKAGRDSHFQL